MPRKYDRRTIQQYFHDRNDNNDGDDHGYHRLEHTYDTKTPMTNNISTLSSCVTDISDQQSSSRSGRGKKNRAFTEVDAQGKRLSKKLRRKEVRKRIGHVLHSTWKWVKRGAVATAPKVATMFMFAPVPVFTFATSSRP